LRDGKNYEVRYAYALNKWPFLSLNAAKLAQSPLYLRQFNLSPSRIYVKVENF
jgi:hypothetical protein